MRRPIACVLTISLQLLLGLCPTSAQRDDGNLDKTIPQSSSDSFPILPAEITVPDGKGLVALNGFEFTLPAEIKWGPNSNATASKSGVLSYVVWLDDQVLLDSVALNSNGLNSLKVVFKSVGSEAELELKHVIRVIPGIVTIIPITCVLLVAFAFHQVLVALWLGVFLASTIANGGNILFGFLRVIDTYLVRALADEDHVRIILFIWFMSGLVTLVMRGGGAQGMAQALGKFVTNRKRAQLLTMALGILIFFDDYASALIVGQNMRVVTDIVGLSHEKLAFIVHATAAGPASVSPISSWVGFELGLIAENLPKPLQGEDPFNIFVETIPYRLYPILMLALIFFLVILGRDFGPMLC